MPMHDSPRDQVLHAMAQQGWANESDGNVEAPTGWFCRISNALDDVVSIIDAFGLEALEIDPNFDFSEVIGHFLLVEDDQGFISVFEFESEWHAANAFIAQQRAYLEWLGSSD